MISTAIVGIVVILAICGWHFRTRRHPNWHRSRDARYYITVGYPLVGIAVFFLANTVDRTDLNWLLGMAWALVAVTLFVHGFQALHSEVEPNSTEIPACATLQTPSVRSVSRPDVDA